MTPATDPAEYNRWSYPHSPGLSYRADARLASLPYIPYVPVTGMEATRGDGRPADTYGQSPEEAAFIHGVQVASGHMAPRTP